MTKQIIDNYSIFRRLGNKLYYIITLGGMFYQSNGGREITLLNILRKCLGLTTIDVLKFRTVAACHKDLDKPHRP